MDARRHASTETPVVRAQRTVGTASRAAGIYARLERLDHDEQEELAASPTEIRAKFEGRRAKLLSEAPDEVRKLVEKMRAP